MMKQLDGSKAAMLTEVAIQDDETFKPEGGFVPETEGLQGQELYNIDEAVDICLRMATENDLDEIFNLIQVVGKEMDCKNNELFAYSKNSDTYLHMLKTGSCAVAIKDDKIIASLLTRPEDNRDGVFDLSGISKTFMPNTIEFVTSQVLKEYRGNKLEQRLINFVLTELNKSKHYKYAICTVCPDNKASLKSVENNNFKICNKANLYGGKTRYILIKELDTTNEHNV